MKPQCYQKVPEVSEETVFSIHSTMKSTKTIIILYTQITSYTRIELKITLANTYDKTI